MLTRTGISIAILTGHPGKSCGHTYVVLNRGIVEDDLVTRGSYDATASVCGHIALYDGVLCQQVGGRCRWHCRSSTFVDLDAGPGCCRVVGDDGVPHQDGTLKQFEAARTVHRPACANVDGVKVCLYVFWTTLYNNG